MVLITEESARDFIKAWEGEVGNHGDDRSRWIIHECAKSCELGANPNVALLAIATDSLMRFIKAGYIELHLTGKSDGGELT